MSKYGPLGVVPLGELVKQRLQKDIVVASPAAGADWTVSVPAGVFWELLTVQATLVASAVVANRYARLEAATAGVLEMRIGAAAAATANQSTRASWLKAWGGISTNLGNGGMTNTLPPLYLPPGCVIGTQTVSIDVGDQWGSISLVVREWSTKGVEAALLSLRQFVEAQADADRIAGH